jgi:hypothetical protein
VLIDMLVKRLTEWRGRGAPHTLLALLVLLAIALAAAAPARAQGGEGRAGLVVQFGDGSVETACVRFAEPEISGIELLERSGLPVVLQSGGVGAAVCKIGPDGCDYPAEGCFCKREGARSIYWAFYSLDGDAWTYASLGAANTFVRDGDVHGWAWGLGDSGGGAQPPAIALDAICGPAAPTTAPEPARATAPAPAPSLPAAASPPPSPATSGSPEGGAMPGLLGFGALALVLAAGVIIAARRRG